MKFINKCLLVAIVVSGCNVLAADIYLVRHAEKTLDGSADPALTLAGEQRAKALAEMLRDANIKQIFSTDTQRTKQTAQPLASALDLPVEIYDAKHLAEFSQRIDQLQHNALIVGHSNTTPQLVSLLLGKEVEPMADWQYDRVYHLSLENGEAKTLHLLQTQPPSFEPKQD